ncbi:lipase [Stylonychia lemnae]|uniref:Lipase n=1 Tax=Stylonychia lemnae TaxID=5949 RepID=A0A078AAZ0_STYLE|nr:lipase [Stylonychia lemnae]|eukprot:CDW78772.1 lipase [Stylonychia lemnae]
MTYLVKQRGIQILSVAVLALVSRIAGQNSTYKRGLTDHFINFLDLKSNYYPYGFNRTQFFGGSFGGKDNDSTPINRVPVVFVHGAADMVIGYGWENDGFRYDIEYFLDHGYTKAEIYGSQWGYADIPNELNLQHDTEWVLQIRRFIEAVLDYTGAPQVDVVSHSMGVTLSRAALKGGYYFLENIQTLFLKPINKRIRTFIGIAGGNYGISLCTMEYYKLNFPICDTQIGFYPGELDNTTNKVKNLSKFMKQLNDIKVREATKTYSIFSLYDASVLPYTLDGKYTSVFPGINAAYIYNSSEYGHLGVRDLTQEFQYNLLNKPHEELPETNVMMKLTFETEEEIPEEKKELFLY